MAIDTPPLATGPSDLPPDDKPPRRWPWMIGLLVLALVTVAIALVVTRPDDGGTSAITTNSTPAANAAIVKAYLDAFAASDAIATNPKASPTDPSLDAVITDPLLSFLHQQFSDFRAKGIVYEPGGLAHQNTHVVEQGSDRAVVRSCLIEKGYATINGVRGPAPGPPGNRTSMEAIAVRDPGTGVWKISSRYPKNDGHECDGA